LRRDIEPWYEDGSTADYVRMESDLVFLDPEMFQVDSVAFSRQATDVLSEGSAAAKGPGLLRLYAGRFAPEFEYEDWADEWRNQVHASYLYLAHATGSALLERRDVASAITVLTAVAAIDPLAFDLRRMLVRSLATGGASDAAHNHYMHLAAAYRSETGGEIPSFEKVVGELPLAL
jgi:two-component SAPR family response regulator